MKHRRQGILAALILAGFSLAAGPAEVAKLGPVSPTVFLIAQEGRFLQLVMLPLPAGLTGEWVAASEQGEARAESRFSLESAQGSVPILVPACPAGACPTRIELRDDQGQVKGASEFSLAYQRRWKIFLSPFSHIDVGFTNSQRKILAQNLDNLRAALDLIEQTRDYPEGARFKFFTEVSWPTSEFLYSEATGAEEKKELIAALQRGEVEVGGFLISHQNKFMPPEALFRSPETALRINRDYGVAISTACLNDLFDFSSVVKPLSGARIPYFLGGPNTNHYVTPPLFYLQPPIGDEKILAWITPNLNGYGENVDLAMRPNLPISQAELAEMEARLGPFLKSLERDGVPPSSVQDHFDFFGANWPYPYDLYLLPYYPPHAVDNGPQDITASELAKVWNRRWAFPKLIIATPAEFFKQAEAGYAEKIPTLRGDLPGFWGEQIFFAMAQVDPERTSVEREFERTALAAEAGAASRLLDGRTVPDLASKISEAYKLIALNNDHNPGPVPFGNTKYGKEDVAEWKATRRQWIARVRELGQGLPQPSRTLAEPPSGKALAAIEGKTAVMENEFFRLEIDTGTGGISRLYDKELGRELAGRDGRYQMNQYVVVARGEDAGTRGNLFDRAGFSKVKVEIVAAGPELARVLVTGETRRNPDAVKVLTRFIKSAFKIRIPGFLIKGAARILGVHLGPVDEVRQEIELKAGTKQVYFIQRVKVKRDQAIDHTFAYPFNLPPERPLIVEGPYNPYRFGPGSPVGDGDLIPAATMMDTNFPGINALTQAFGWMYGVPADAVFSSYALAMGDGFGIAFSSLDSGVILPGPLDKDPISGPFGGGFQHLVLGWTAYGQSFLGAPQEGDFIFRSALTSFAAKDEAEAKTIAARFGRGWGPAEEVSPLAQSSNPAVLVTMIRPLADGSLLVRLHESSGAGGETTVTLPGRRAIAAAGRARSDGLPLSNGPLSSTANAFSIGLGPGEVATVKVELK